MRFGWLAAGLLLAPCAASRAAPPAAKPKPTPTATAADAFQITNWFSLEPAGAHLIRQTPLGRAVASAPQENWEEITVFGHRRSAAAIAADERFHAGDPVYEAATSDLAAPAIKQPAAPTLFDYKF